MDVNIDPIRAMTATTPDMNDWMKNESSTPDLHLARCLAVVLHDNQCYSNHTDGCGWFYRAKDVEYSRGQYLGLAKKAVEVRGAVWASSVINAYVEAKVAKQVLMKLLKNPE